MPRANDALSVTVLHVSDTQFGRYHRFDPDDSLAGYLIRDVAGLLEAGVPGPDLVVLSGDIAERSLRSEYDQATAFIEGVCAEIGLDAERVVVVPGNHDVNWDLSAAYFAERRADEAEPLPPYARKWRHYQEFVTRLHGPAAFTEEQPWRLHRFGGLRVVVAAMNSTITESHQDCDHYGWCGRDQLRWFADRLGAADDVLRIGVLHHNARRRAQADNENLRDEDDLTAIVGGGIDLLLHGHTHEGKEDRLADGTLVLATGSAAVSADWRPAEVPNQYQVIQVRPDSVTRWTQQWDSRAGRWIGDTRASRNGREPVTQIALAVPGWRQSPGRAPQDPASRSGRSEFIDRLFGDRADDFTRQVQLVTRVDLGDDVVIDPRSMPDDGGTLTYLLALPPGAPARCVGVVSGRADADWMDRFDAKVFAPLRERGAVEFVVVHHGPEDPQLRALARERGIRLKTWTEYNSLLELGPYRSWLKVQLDEDKLYPQPLYQPQRFRDIDRFGRAGEQVRDDLLGCVYDAVLDEDGRFVLVLGDAGFGKSFLVRRLAYRLLGNPAANLTPIVVYLRDRDKRQTLDEMVSAALLPSKAAFHADRFAHSLEAGSLLLLIDGYDEFAVRVGYANAAAQLRTFTEALRGKAKVVLTTRPSHFRSTDEVTTSLFESLRNLQSGRVYQLEPFDESQQRAFLVRWFELAGQDDPGALAERWMAALGAVDNLPELAKTPRMLSFIVEDLSLESLHEAAHKGTVTAAQLYQTLVTHWLGTETSKIDPTAPGTLTPGQRQELLEELALRLWRAGERDVTEDALQQTARDVLDLPKLDLTLDQAAQEAGGRTLLQVDQYRWKFAHQSVWEFLLARKLAALLRAGTADDVLGEAQLTDLTIRFLRDLAPAEAEAWVGRVEDEQ